MSVLYKKFELPENIELTEDPENSNRALVTVAPLEKGFGHTLGNALRRTAVMHGDDNILCNVCQFSCQVTRVSRFKCRVC